MKNILWHMQGKEIRYQAVCRGSNPDYPISQVWIASMANKKHASIMANTWSTLLQKSKCKHQVGGGLVAIIIPSICTGNILGYMMLITKIETNKGTFHLRNFHS